MAMDFPASPTNGQIYAPANAPSYMWDSAAGVWSVYLPTAGVGAAYAYVGDSPPASPSNGQMWIETDSGLTYAYVNDGSSSQWIQISGAGLTDAPSDGLTWARKNGVWVATDGTGGAMNGPAFIAQCTNGLSIPAQVINPPTIFATELYDSDNAYNPTNGRFTPQVAGYYQFNVTWQPISANPTRAFASLLKNAVEFCRGTDMSATGSLYYAGNVSGIIYMNGTTDWAGAGLWFITAATVNSFTTFSGALVRKA